jgi:hypothetical protein
MSRKLFVEFGNESKIESGWMAIDFNDAARDGLSDCDGKIAFMVR